MFVDLRIGPHEGNRCLFAIECDPLVDRITRWATGIYHLPVLAFKVFALTSVVEATFMPAFTFAMDTDILGTRGDMKSPLSGQSSVQRSSTVITFGSLTTNA